VGDDIRAAYAVQLRKQWEGRVPWSHFGRIVGRIVGRIERGEPVVVPSWTVRRWTGLPAGAFGGPEFLELRANGDVVPVVPVKAGVDISAWAPA
jgi:hypothetical protein